MSPKITWEELYLSRTWPSSSCQHRVLSRSGSPFIARTAARVLSKVRRSYAKPPSERGQMKVNNIDIVGIGTSKPEYIDTVEAGPAMVRH